LFFHHERKVMKHTILMAAAIVTLALIAGLSSSYINSAQLPAKDTKAVTMFKSGSSENAVIAATADTAGVAAVPDAVTALIKSGADAGKVTAAAVSVGADPAAVINNAVAAGGKSSTVVNSAINAGAAPEKVAEAIAEAGGTETEHAETSHEEAGHTGVGVYHGEGTGFTGVPPLVTPVPSGGGGGIPASRS
jgi:hypothetical protein